MVSAKMRAPPTLSSSRFTLVTTACFQSQGGELAPATHARALPSRWVAAYPLGTANLKPQRLVQMFPRSMKVAVRLWFTGIH